MDETAENLIFTLLYKMAKGERIRARKLSKSHLKLLVPKLEESLDEGFYWKLSSLLSDSHCVGDAHR